MPLKEVEDTFGKDIAEKFNNSGSRLINIQGDNLKAGGKGMIGFYGSPIEGKEGIVGKTAKELVKELTGKEGKIGETKINISKGGLGINKERFENGIELARKDKNEEAVKYLQEQYDSYKKGNGFSWDLVNNEGVAGKYMQETNRTNTQHSIEITPELKAAVDKGMPLFKKEEQNTPFQTRDGNPIGFDYDTDKVARERFDFSKLEKIGSGSDRDVYDLKNGKVLKVAKTARGLEQNIYEGDGYLSFVPQMYERGLNYVVVDNVPRIKMSDMVEIFDWDGNVLGEVRASEMFNDLKKFSTRDFERHDSKLGDILAKYGLQDARSYDVLWFVWY